MTKSENKNSGRKQEVETKKFFFAGSFNVAHFSPFLFSALDFYSFSREFCVVVISDK